MHSLTDLKRAVVLAPTDPRARFELAEALFSEEQFTQAAAQLEKALELSPDDANAHRMLARCYERGGANEKALKTLENFVRQRPDDADAREELVGYFLQQGRPDDAILHAVEGVRLQPTDVQRMLFLADLLVSRRLPERAREVLEVAHRVAPEEPKVTRLLKDVYELLGDEVAQDRVAGEKERGYFLRQAKLAASSKVLAEEARAAGLGQALELLAKGDDVGLRRALNAASAEQRASAAGLFFEGELFLLGDDDAAARRSFESALERAPQLGLAWNRLGDIAQGRHQLRDAVTLYKKALLLGVDDANAWEDLGDVHASLGETEAATRAWTRAAERDPQGGGAKKLASLNAPRRRSNEEPQVGKIGVLGWSPSGGAVSPLEAVAVPGTGQLLFSGNVGATGKESATVAFSVLKARAHDIGIDGLVRGFDLHLHYSDTAIGKDGPSAGLALLLAGVSAFTQRRVRAGLCATGELTLHGNVQAVGGIHEKLVAAHLAGYKTVLLPRQNLRDARALPDEVKRSLELIHVETVVEAIHHALLEASKG